MDSNSHKVTASVAPPPAAAPTVTDEVNSAEFKQFGNIAQKSETDVPLHQVNPNMVESLVLVNLS